MSRDLQPQSNSFLNLIDTISSKIGSTKTIDSSLLLTENRGDILLRKNFLDDIISKNKTPNQTLYYQFISDSDRGISRNPDESSKNFLELFEDIKLHGVKKPLLITKITSKILNARYIFQNEKHWKKYENFSGFQLVDGAHRLAILLYLNTKNIPVKIIHSRGFEIPDYTEFLKLKSKGYLKNIE